MLKAKTAAAKKEELSCKDRGKGLVTTHARLSSGEKPFWNLQEWSGAGRTSQGGRKSTQKNKWEKGSGGL